MGMNNQRRRAAKRRQRVRRAEGRNGHTPGSGPPGRGADAPFVDRPGEERGERVAEDVMSRHRAQRAVDALMADADAWPADLLAEPVTARVLAGGERHGRLCEEVLTERMLAVVAAVYEHGWEPADLIHVARRLDAKAGRLMAAAVTEQARRTRAAERAPRGWADQLRDAADLAGSGGRAGGVDGFGVVGVHRERGSTEVSAWGTAVRLAVCLESLPVLTRQTDPPSAWGRSAPRPRPAPGAADRDRMLGKIRALLAKAEATTYEAEAEALTAKAQDLMTRHAVDEALLSDGTEERVAVRSLRIRIETPYPAEKVSLLTQVARANRCRSVWLESYAIATLVGTPVDVEQVDLLFTSLLVQGTRAVAEAGRNRAGSFDRSASFRRSFLMAYGQRIGERLTEAAEATTRSYGGELVPVLRRQAAAVEEEFGRLFPHVYERSSGGRYYSQRGWEAGRDAADRATFVAGRIAAS